MLSIPFVGPWVASLFFGGEFPTPDILSRLFVFHVMLLPGLLIGGIAAHLGLLWLQKHTQYRTPRTREDNVVGLPFWPGQVSGRRAVLHDRGGRDAGRRPDPDQPGVALRPVRALRGHVPAQPDWYVGWLEGALRLGLPIEPTILGVTIPSPFVPGRADPGAAGHALAVWPFLEARLTHDHVEHHLLDRRGGRRSEPRPGPPASRCSWSSPSRVATTSWPR